MGTPRIIFAHIAVLVAFVKHKGAIGVMIIGPLVKRIVSKCISCEVVGDDISHCPPRPSSVIPTAVMLFRTRESAAVPNIMPLLYELLIVGSEEI